MTALEIEQKKRRKREYDRRWHEENKEYRKEYARRLAQRNGNTKREYMALWRANNPSRITKHRRTYYLKHAEKRRAYSKEYRKTHLEEEKAYYKAHDKLPHRVEAQRISSKRYYANNKDKRRAYAKANSHKRLLVQRARIARNPERTREYFRLRARRKAATDVRYRILGALRHRIWMALKGHCYQKCAKTKELLGCSIDDFRIYLESKFEPGMCWENYGVRGWHIDHIMPCAIFDLTKPEHQRRCFHFSNTQPMWALDNIRKNDTLPNEQLQSA